MKHVIAILIKAVMVWAILWIVLTGIYDVNFIDATVVGAFIFVLLYLVGDLLVLRKFGNVAAILVDVVTTAIVLWVYLSSLNAVVDIGAKVLMSTILIGIGEWFFHNWLLKHRIVPDEHIM